MNTKQIVPRLAVYIAGLFLVAMGVAVAINSNLGISPSTSFPYAVSLITPINLGVCTVLVHALYIAIQVLLLRRDFKPVQFAQIIFASIFGSFLEVGKLVVGAFSLPGYPGQLVMMALSIFLIGLGVFLYVRMDILPMAPEGLALALSRRTGRPFSTTKIWVDCAAVLLAILLSFVFLGRLSGIREGTVITALLVGKAVALWRRLLSPTLKSFGL